MDVERNFEEFIKPKYNMNFVLKEEQIRIIHYVLQRQHTMGVLPTGFGKSMCFILPPLLLNIHIDGHVSLVISPLISLMKSQCEYLLNMGVSCAVVTRWKNMTDDVKYGIEKGSYNIIFISPEAIMKMEKWRKIILENDVYQENLCVVALDEVHLLEQWGEEFRPVYKCLGELRSHFYSTPFLMLTGTITENTKTIVMKELQLHPEEVKIIAVTCDRPNIFLEIKTKQQSPVEEFSSYLNDLKVNGIKTSKAILYVRSFSMIGNILKDFMAFLKDEAYKDKVRLVDKRLVDVYHAGQYIDDQERILKEFSKENSVIRLLICTVAFGMGIDIHDVRYVFHWGCSNSFIEYWQEIGRAGRDGESAKALCVVLPTTFHTSDSMKELLHDVRKQSIHCIRQRILEELTIKEMNVQIVTKSECKLKCNSCTCVKCKCCSVCQSNCPCQKLLMLP